MKKTNNHVERLHRYLPFNPVHDQIYEEYQRSADSLSLETGALSYLVDIASQKDAKLVILTGDAGHGKTHLCRRLLEEHHGYTQDEARELINTKCDARAPIQGKADARPLLIHKDFSELEEKNAADLVENAFRLDAELMVICANEGRLRSVLESQAASDGCQRVLGDFKRSFGNGLCSQDGVVHIINLNFQSVAASGGNSLLKGTLHDWLSGTRWSVCKECDSAPYCPIFHNRNLLDVRNNELADLRRERIEILFSTLERLGVVVTIREMLMAVAYLLTGGLTCKKVHGRPGKRGWQHVFSFYNVLFAPPPGITSDMLARIPVMLELPRLDPGMRAARIVDERLINEQNIFPPDELDLIYNNDVFKRPPVIDASSGIDEVIGNPTSRKERKTEADFVERIVRSLRRRAFFDEDEELGTPLDRLGFENAADFSAICTGDLGLQRMARLKNRLLSGLHVIQGLQMSRSETNLFLVDPAFGSATSHAAIISRTIPSSSIKLLSMSAAWDVGDENQRRAMAGSVDWIDRHIVVRFVADDASHDLPLDLMAFDCLSRAGSGYVAEEFYAHDLKRIKNFLGRLSEKSEGSHEGINLFLNGAMHSVSIDEGMIQVGGGLQ